ncbi:MAG: SDR family oxidoreductase, partial [Actinobacteria bacterium]|nr:SDR family oxidoreductase [Actinomycetota bacterium]
VRAAERHLEAGPEAQVNALCPGWVATDMAWEGLEGMAAWTGTTREAARAEAMKAVPLGRMGEPEDVAGTVAWLLSPDARGVTGQSIDQNGGAFMS